MPVQKYLDHYQSNLKGHQCVTCMVYVKILRKITQKFIQVINLINLLIYIFMNYWLLPQVQLMLPSLKEKFTTEIHVMDILIIGKMILRQKFSSLVGHKPDRQTDIPVCIRTCCCR